MTTLAVFLGIASKEKDTMGIDSGAPTSWTVTDTENLTVQAEKEGGVLVARVTGRVDGANAREFQEALESAVGESELVVLDLEALSYISSAGLRVMLLLAKALRRQDAKFAVCSLTDRIREVFEISGFDKIIPVHASQDKAITALEG